MTAITPDTHAKTIFTSGSTGKPKAVIQTQRILTGIVAQHQAMYEEADHETQARAFLSWVPWSHVGGNNTLPADVLNERSEEHTSELQSLLRISYAIFCLTQKHYQNYQ